MLPFFNPFLLTTSVRGNQTKNSAKPLTASAWRKHTLNPASQPQLSKRSKQSTEDKENNCFILPNVVSPVIVKRQSDKIVDEIADGKLKSKKQRFTYEEIVRDQLDQLDGNQELADETIAKIASLLERAGKELLINETQKRKLFSEKDWKLNTICSSKRVRFATRMQLLKDFMKELFRAKPEVKFEQILTYVITWHIKTVPNVVRQVHGVSMSLVDVVLSAADALKTHFLVGQSYALFWRFASALSVSTKKKFVM